jgi:glycosyltransferase involved in cell wall biosynthesis
MIRVATILPPREMFSPLASGAIGLLVQRLSRMAAGPASRIYGMATVQPFAGLDFRPVRLSWLPGSQALRYARGLARALRAEPADLIEVHNRPDIALYLARRFPAVPVMLFLHNDPQGMRGARTRSDRAALLRRVAVVPVSRYLAGRMDAPDLPILANCIDLAALPPRDAGQERQRRILFVGRVVADKGADSFVAACAEALPQLPGWEAVIIGADRFGPNSPDTPFLASLRPRAAASGIAMPGYLPHDQILAAMAEAAIVVVPSRWAEPFGLTALEAMACGAALICSQRGGLAEVAGEAALVIDPDRPETIAAAILALARDPTRRTALAERGRLRAAGFDAPQARLQLATLRRQVMQTWPSRQTHPI